MDRKGRIVYLGTEDNAKSCLGLEEILNDGWNVRLVIAYIIPVQEMPRQSLLTRARQSLVSVVRSCPQLYNLARRILGKQKPLAFKRMEELCQQYNVPYKQTVDKSLQTLNDLIANIAPDIVLSNGWMFKVTKDTYSLARLMAINCHSSYLPEYRGGNVTYAPLINEEKQSGVTVHQLVERFDAGPILAQERVSIEHGETPQSLNVKRAQITGRTLITALEKAGHEELYKPNPPSPFYFRCTFAAYKHYKRMNSLRKLVGLPIKHYEPRERYDI